MLRISLAAVTVMITGGPATSVFNWVGLYRVGDPNEQWTAWVRMSGTKWPPLTARSTAFLTFVLPAPGDWEVRFFEGTGYTGLRKVFPVASLPPPVLSPMSNEWSVDVTEAIYHMAEDGSCDGSVTVSEGQALGITHPPQLATLTGVVLTVVGPGRIKAAVTTGAGLSVMPTAVPDKGSQFVAWTGTTTFPLKPSLTECLRATATFI